MARLLVSGVEGGKMKTLEELISALNEMPCSEQHLPYIVSILVDALRVINIELARKAPLFPLDAEEGSDESP